MLDLLIRDGFVVDGTGAMRRRADVGIRGGRIVEVGAIKEGASQVIDAEGRIVCPGFIDVHTHFDAQAFWDPALTPSPLHGVTSIIGGNCGFSIAPLNEDAAGYLMRMLARVEGMPLRSLEIGVPWNWRTTAEYLDQLENRLAVNAGFMVGHSSLRRVVMGEAANERTARLAELEAMKELLRRGLAAGGLGFSSTMSPSHNDAEGSPVPSRHAASGEFLDLAAVCKEFPGTSLEFLPDVGPDFSDSAVDLMIGLSVTAQRPVNWNVLMPDESNAEETQQKLGIGDRARRLGGKVVALTMPMHIAARLCFLSGFILDMLPGWADAMALPKNEKLALLSDRSERKKLEEMARRPGPSGMEPPDWGSRMIVEAFTPNTKRFEGRLVAEIAKEEGKSSFDALVDIAIEDDLRTTFVVPYEDSRGDWEARVQAARDSRALIGGSDAGAHLDMLGTFCYSTQVLQEIVRNQGLMTVEEAVHLMTEAPANLYGLRDRGILTEGACGDLVVFDEDRVGRSELVSRFDLPGGAPRLYAESIGVEHVLVNGQPIVQDGKLTGSRPGTVLRSGRDTATPTLNGTVAG